MTEDGTRDGTDDVGYSEDIEGKKVGINGEDDGVKVEDIVEGDTDEVCKTVGEITGTRVGDFERKIVGVKVVGSLVGKTDSGILVGNPEVGRKVEAK